MARLQASTVVQISVHVRILLLVLFVACGGSDPADPADPDASATGDGNGSSGELALLYSGPVANAVVPSWSASAPQPLIVEALLAQTQTWWVSIARISPDGRVSGIVADEVRIWGWPSGSSVAPSKLAAGPLSTTRVPSWSQAAPRPLVLGARQNGSQDWFVAVAKVDPTGALSELVVDDVTVWGWQQGGPMREYAGAASGASVSWNASSPRPLIVLANQSQPDWFVSLAGVEPTGAVGGIVADTIHVWGF